MGELGTGEPPRKIDVGNTVSGSSVKDASRPFVDLEQIPEGRRLVAAIRSILLGDGVVQANFPHPSNRDGDMRFVTVDGTDREGNSAQVLLMAIRREQGGNRPNQVRVVWMDEKNRKEGDIVFVDGEKGYADPGVNGHRVLDSSINEWHEDGGMDHNPPFSRSMTREEIGVLAEQLESAKPNKEMTDRAMQRLETASGGVKVENPMSQSALPQPNEKKE